MTDAALATDWTRLVGCELPIQLAGMGGAAGPELVAAVAGAGGLGMLGAPMIPAEVLRQMLAGIQERTEAPVGVTFLVPFLDLEAVDVAAEGARVVEFFYGDPEAELVERAAAEGALVSWQVGSVSEARAAEDAGCDFVVAQGVEAGGHLRGTIGTLALLGGALDAVSLPVVAAGGIGDARAMAACLAAGAGGVRMGTRFLAAEEADVHPEYRDAVLEAGPEDTVVTTAFSGMWPDAPHRVLRSAIAAAEALEGELAGQMRIPGGEPMPVPRLSVPCPDRSTTGNIRAMALYAGESVGAVRRSEPAASILEELATGAARLLRRDS